MTMFKCIKCIVIKNLCVKIKGAEFWGKIRNITKGMIFEDGERVVCVIDNK